MDQECASGDNPEKPAWPAPMLQPLFDVLPGQDGDGLLCNRHRSDCTQYRLFDQSKAVFQEFFGQIEVVSFGMNFCQQDMNCPGEIPDRCHPFFLLIPVPVLDFLLPLATCPGEKFASPANISIAAAARNGFSALSAKSLAC